MPILSIGRRHVSRCDTRKHHLELQEQGKLGTKQQMLKLSTDLQPKHSEFAEDLAKIQCLAEIISEGRSG